MVLELLGKLLRFADEPVEAADPKHVIGLAVDDPIIGPVLDPHVSHEGRIVLRVPDVPAQGLEERIQVLVSQRVFVQAPAILRAIFRESLAQPVQDLEKLIELAATLQVHPTHSNASASVSNELFGVSRSPDRHPGEGGRARPPGGLRRAAEQGTAVQAASP